MKKFLIALVIVTCAYSWSFAQEKTMPPVKEVKEAVAEKKMEKKEERIERKIEKKKLVKKAVRKGKKTEAAAKNTAGE